MAEYSLNPELDRVMAFLRRRPGEWFEARALKEHPMLKPSAEVGTIIRWLCRQAELGKLEYDGLKGFRVTPPPVERGDV